MEKTKTANLATEKELGDEKAAEPMDRLPQSSISGAPLDHRGYYAPNQLPPENTAIISEANVARHGQDLSDSPPQPSMQPIHRHTPAKDTRRQVTSPAPFPAQVYSNQQCHGAAYAASARGTATQNDQNKPTKHRTAALIQLPEHAYFMPHGPALNFTVVEILVILPNWFKNQFIAWRLINNGLNSAIHSQILQDHRIMDIAEDNLPRFRDGVSDQYRRTMRMMNPMWTRGNHRIPGDWDRGNLSVNQFYPDAAVSSGYNPPAPIPFKALMASLKKLPQGPDAGDLTRALGFATSKPKSSDFPGAKDWMFPDDIHIILNHIGYSTITNDHVDGAAFLRYHHIIRGAIPVVRKRRHDPIEAGSLIDPKRRHMSKSETPERHAHSPNELMPNQSLSLHGFVANPPVTSDSWTQNVGANNFQQSHDINAAHTEQHPDDTSYERWLMTTERESTSSQKFAFTLSEAMTPENENGLEADIDMTMKELEAVLAAHQHNSTNHQASTEHTRWPEYAVELAAFLNTDPSAPVEVTAPTPAQPTPPAENGNANGASGLFSKVIDSMTTEELEAFLARPIESYLNDDSFPLPDLTARPAKPIVNAKSEGTEVAQATQSSSAEAPATCTLEDFEAMLDAHHDYDLGL